MPMIKTENLSKSFGALDVLKNCNISVEQGEVVVIIGPSGAGKSTFLRSLNHLETINNGKIWVEGKLLDDRIDSVNHAGAYSCAQVSTGEG
jgi:ABC-type polar amino acid transport system ATPase subunit